MKVPLKVILLCFVSYSIATSALFGEVESAGVLFKKEDSVGEHHINFTDVSAIEFIRFVSKISKVNFIFDHQDLSFNITLSSGKPLKTAEVVTALIQTLRARGFAVSEEGSYFVIRRLSQEEQKQRETNPTSYVSRSEEDSTRLLLSGTSLESSFEFATYKLRYHQGDEIEGALKKIASDMSLRRDKPFRLIEAIQTIQWVKATNSLFFSADRQTVESLDKLIKTLDIPRRQVFIEVLVVETDAKKSTEFGLQWVGGGKFKDRISFGGMHSAGRGAVAGAPAAPGGGLSVLDQIPFSRGFDFRVIGDLILHKGKTFFSLGSLVSALQTDGDATIILNQKIITQDNKNSKIFVGDNIPFTGTVVHTVGASQQTTANIEYRDVGVKLSITPMLGEDNVITLTIDQEITEAVDDPHSSGSDVEGIRTTKTNMATQAYVPDNHFLMLSGMVRNARMLQKAGIPCLGGIPFLGSLASRQKNVREKRNVLIFVRPHIIDSFEDYLQFSEQEAGSHATEQLGQFPSPSSKPNSSDESSST